MKIPDSADCASSVALGNVTARCRRRLLLDLQRRAGGRVLLRIHRDPAAVLDLLDTHQIVTVVVRPVKAQMTLDGVGAVLLEISRNCLVVEAVRPLDAGLETLPR